MLISSYQNSTSDQFRDIVLESATFRNMDVAVIGLGKLGLPLAVLLAENGHKVFGFDKNESLIRLLENSVFETNEPDLMSRLQRVKDLKFCAKPEEIGEVEIIFLIVPTPSKASGEFSNEILINAILNISEKIKEIANTKEVVINIVSTVMPGSCNGEIRKAIEDATDLTQGEDFHLCYNPEFVALGSVIQDMEYPDMHLIGSNDANVAVKVLGVLGSISKKEVPKARLTIEEAELVKIAVNNFVTMKISFANGLLQVAKQLENVNIENVTSAIGMDSRIGGKYLKGALPYGGPCFPRDTRALSAMYSRMDIENKLSETTEKFNRSHAEFWAVEIGKKTVGDRDMIGIIGVSYKVGTPVIDDSPAVLISDLLIRKGFSVSYWDDEAALMPAEGVKLPERFDNLAGLLQVASVVFITRPLSNHGDLELIRNFSGKVLDPWGVLK